ncbi:MAG: hypothetical protein JW820_10665 [Spirochaetales bacterium]|nr:hypothetical protein [Spirochaetales bacterium]
MHAFYDRVETEFRRRGASRNRFCKDNAVPYSTLAAYWHTDELPPGDILVKIALYLGASLDYLVWGRTEVSGRKAIREVVTMLESYSDEQVAELKGALGAYILYRHMLPTMGERAGG